MSKTLNTLNTIYNNKMLPYEINRYKSITEAFISRFGTPASPLRYFSSPGRTEIGGNHTDHNFGKVIAGSINLDCIGAVSPTTDTITIYDLTYNENFTINVNDTARISGEKGSIALVRGILDGFKKAGYKIGGFNGCFTSDVIAAAGVSSSASFEMIICTILNVLYNDNKLSVSSIAKIGQYAENMYWDKGSGLLDQIACATGGMITIDFNDPQNPVIDKIPFDFDSQNYTMVIVNTGKGHADLSAEYSSIPNEMKSIAKYFNKTTLSQITETDVINNLLNIRKECGDRAVLRAFHFFNENKKVELEKKALLTNDFQLFLKLITESGNSSWKWLQNICVPGFPTEQPIAICLALTENFIEKYNVGACRVHGGGFAGVIQSFIPNKYVEEYTQYMNNALGWTEKSTTRSPVYPMKIRAIGSVEVSFLQ